MEAALQAGMIRRLLLAVLLAGQASAATLHVSPGGDDAAPGSLDAPWRTIQHAMRRAQPGDEVRVAAGVYREAVRVEGGGRADAPVTVQAEPGATLLSPDPAASLEGFDVVAGVGHLVIAGFALRGFAESIMLRPGSHDVTIRDCVVDGGDVGIWIAGATGVTVDGCTLARNRLGLRISGASADVLVVDTLSLGNDDGAGCDGDADGFSVEETARDVRFLRCAAIGNGEDGFDLQGDGMLVAASTSRDNGCAGIKLGQGARVENTLVAANTTGIAAASFFGAPVRVELVNDTIADNRGVQLLLRARTAEAAQASSALLRNLIAAGPGKIVEIEWPLQLEEDHNLFFRPDTTSPVIVRHDADGERRYSGQAINAGLWAAESGQGIGTLAVEPRFAELTTWRVADDSPAVDRGAEPAAPATDRDGVPRPAGTASDIGADELAGVLPAHLPWPDPGPDRDIQAGSRVRLTAYGSVDPAGAPLGYIWDFGDGGPAAFGDTTQHAWTVPGEYALSLTVANGVRTHTRVARVRVHPSGTAMPTPVVTPTPAGHDTELRAAARRLRLRIPAGTESVSGRIEVIVRNADLHPLPERPGHAIRLVAEPGTCPAGLVVFAPDLAPRRRGAQDTLLLGGGRRRRAAVMLRAEAAAIHTPDRRTPLRCALLVRALGPDGDPTPDNNVAVVDIELRDENDW